MLCVVVMMMMHVMMLFASSHFGVLPFFGEMQICAWCASEALLTRVFLHALYERFTEHKLVRRGVFCVPHRTPGICSVEYSSCYASHMCY